MQRTIISNGRRKIYNEQKGTHGDQETPQTTAENEREAESIACLEEKAGCISENPLTREGFSFIG
jgi:hypothetical protein